MECLAQIVNFFSTKAFKQSLTHIDLTQFLVFSVQFKRNALGFYVFFTFYGIVIIYCVVLNRLYCLQWVTDVKYMGRQ